VLKAAPLLTDSPRLARAQKLPLPALAPMAHQLSEPGLVGQADGAEGSEGEHLQTQSGEVSHAHRALVARIASGAAAAVVAGAVFTCWSTLRGSGPLQTRGIPEVQQKWNRPMPAKSSQYDGVEDTRDFWINTKDDVVHIFAVGDWGALLPSHQTASCKHGWDCTAQFQVANAMRARARWTYPQYIINVGDNFYYAGLSTSCNAPPGAAWGAARAAFGANWMYMYGELSNKPWISCLGNHDYGGWQMNNGWPQQIGFSFVNHNWIMPARYYNRKVQHKDFMMEYFVIDSNVFDAKDPHISDHNICSLQHNPGGAECTANDGMPNVWSCPGWFWGSYKWQQRWLEQKVKESTAQWKIVVTHFPCGYDGSWYRGLYEKHGLDLLITGHRHQQELWWWGSTSRYIQKFMRASDMGELPCFVTGGGGGITAEWFSDADYGTDLQLYGFFDLTVAKDWMTIDLIATDNTIKGNRSISPSSRRTIPARNPKPAEPEASESAKHLSRALLLEDDWARSEFE